MPVLKTQRLTLRPILPSDAAALFLMRSDPMYLARAGGDPFEDMAPIRRMVNGMAQGNTDGRACCLAIVKDDTVIGIIELLRLKQVLFRSREWTLGFGLAQPFWQQGYMSEALQVVLPTIYRLGAHRITAEVALHNAASSGLLLSLGFKAEGVLRDKGYWGGCNHDLMSYSLLRADCDARLARSSTALAA